MIIKLTKDQWEYLNDKLAQQESELKNKFSIIEMKDSFVLIDISEESADKIRDWALDSQIQIGFDANYMLTSEGKLLENLIDVFYTG